MSFRDNSGKKDYYETLIIQSFSIKKNVNGTNYLIGVLSVVDL
jgi:hypothetical protein